MVANSQDSEPIESKEYPKVPYNAKKFKKVRFGDPPVKNNTNSQDDHKETEVAIIGTYQSDEVNNIFMDVEEEEDMSQQLDDN